MATHKAKPLSGISLNYEVVGGTTAPTTFNKENTIWVNTGTAIGEHQFSNKDLSIQTISYNQKWSVESAYLSNTGAVVTGDTYWNITAFIDISNSRAVRYTGVTFIEDNRTNICFYDSSQNYISRQAMTAGSKTVTDIPSGAKYLRMCVRKNDKTDYQTLYIYVDKWVDGNIPATGDVWIQTDIDKAPVSFNAIKRDELMVAPYKVYQWNGSSWIRKETTIYRNGSNIKTIIGAIRYIRDSINGSNKNNASHWVEIQAFDESGTNIAKSKTTTLISGTAEAQSNNTSLVTNGDTTSANYFSATGINPIIQVDLGAIYNISSVKIWHYYSDSRVYNSPITQVSADGSNWFTISNGSTYTETSSGKTWSV